MSEIWERELDDLSGDDMECCDECGDYLQNGEYYYEIGGKKLCEYCMNEKYRRCMDYDEDDYSYHDYLIEKFERERDDG